MKILLLLLLSGTAFGQTWFKVTGASQSATVTIPSGVTYRWGSPAQWCDSVTLTKTTQFKPITSSSFACTINGASAPNTAGTELDILETASPIAVTVNGEAATVTIPAAAGSTPPPPAAVPGTAAYCSTGKAKTYTITTTATYNAAGFLTTGTAVMTCN